MKKTKHTKNLANATELGALYESTGWFVEWLTSFQMNIKPIAKTGITSTVELDT